MNKDNYYYKKKLDDHVFHYVARHLDKDLYPNKITYFLFFLKFQPQFHPEVAGVLEKYTSEIKAFERRCNEHFKEYLFQDEISEDLTCKYLQRCIEETDKAVEEAFLNGTAMSTTQEEINKWREAPLWVRERVLCMPHVLHLARTRIKKIKKLKPYTPFELSDNDLDKIYREG